MKERGGGGLSQISQTQQVSTYSFVIKAKKDFSIVKKP
jgi:hypothetical protein